MRLEPRNQAISLAKGLFEWQIEFLFQYPAATTDRLLCCSSDHYEYREQGRSEHSKQTEVEVATSRQLRGVPAKTARLHDQLGHGGLPSDQVPEVPGQSLIFVTSQTLTTGGRKHKVSQAFPFRNAQVLVLEASVG